MSDMPLLLPHSNGASLYTIFLACVPASCRERSCALGQSVCDKLSITMCCSGGHAFGASHCCPVCSVVVITPERESVCVCVCCREV